MASRATFRLRDIVDAINQIEKILEKKTFADVNSDRLIRAGFERFLEIVSEASRHVPTEMKQLAPDIPWSDIAAIGNHLRHAYHQVDLEILWRIYEDGDLADLRDVVTALLNGKV